MPNSTTETPSAYRSEADQVGTQDLFHDEDVEYAPAQRQRRPLPPRRHPRRLPRLRPRVPQSRNRAGVLAPTGTSAEERDVRPPETEGSPTRRSRRGFRPHGGSN